MPGLRERLKKAKDLVELQLVWEQVKHTELPAKAKRRCSKAYDEKFKQLGGSK